MWAILLQGAGESMGPLATLGVGGGIAALVIAWSRIDRKEAQDRYSELAKESRESYAALAKESLERTSQIAAEFRTIVQDNTKALTALSEKFESNDALTVRMLVQALR